MLSHPAPTITWRSPINMVPSYNPYVTHTYLRRATSPRHGTAKSRSAHGPGRGAPSENQVRSTTSRTRIATASAASATMGGTLWILSAYRSTALTARRVSGRPLEVIIQLDDQAHPLD